MADSLQEQEAQVPAEETSRRPTDGVPWACTPDPARGASPVHPQTWFSGRPPRLKHPHTLLLNSTSARIS